MAGWSAALCTHCWIMMHPDREPVRLVQPHIEVCSDCGRYTLSGIYHRKAPGEQNYPTKEHEEEGANTK